MTGEELASVFGPGRWSSRWIWGPNDEPGAGRRVVGLRRDVTLESVPAVVPTRVCAVARYALYVNGREVIRGPMRASRRRSAFDVVDIASYIAPGANALGAIAWIYDDPLPWWLPPYRDARGAFVLEAVAGEGIIATDASWRALTVNGWTLSPPEGTQGRGREHLEGSSLPADWCEVGAADAWDMATERRSPMPGEWGRAEPPTALVGPTHARRVTLPSVQVRPLVARGSDAWCADGVVAGTVRVDVEGPSGAVIKFDVAERLDGDGLPKPSRNDSGFSVRLEGTRRVIETLDSYGLSGVAVHAEDGAVLHAIDVAERQHPVVGNASFACSDDRLDRIWAVGRHTVSLCSWDAYLDCPTREQRAWVGDAVVHQMVDLTTNADWSLARWYPHMSASPRSDGMLPMAVSGDIEHNDTIVIPDWALHWVHAVWILYRYVGDREEIAALMPVVEGVVRWFDRFCDEDGLPTCVLGAVLIDWASVYVDDTSSALCGLWGRALLEYAEMARWLGDRARAHWAAACHRRLRTGFRKFWDGKHRRFADVISDGSLRSMASQHGQAAAIVGGLVPQRRMQRAVEVLTDESNLVHAAFSAPDGPSEPNSEVEVGGSFVVTGRGEPWWEVDREIVRAQPFFRYVVHDALAAAGRADLIASQCLDWTVLLERCPTSWSETWYGGTICHAWSSTPTRDLVMHVLGIQPAEPGFAVASVEPHLGHLAWAKGSAPTPLGPIRVEADLQRVVVDSPVPFSCGGRRYEAGRATIATQSARV